jgi:mannitol/fructose-specific phosphotransferase system IIA component (Ntr-type)
VKKVVNQLVQLQELEFALAEARDVTHEEARVDGLTDAIDGLLATLPEGAAELHRRLRRRDTTTIVPEIDGRCSACSMMVPTAQIAAIRTAERLQQCQGCGRILYRPDPIVRSVARGSPLARRVAGIARFSALELMLPGLEATDRDSAIRELADLMAEQEFIEQPEEFTESALRREALASTALPHGIAVPHARGVIGGGLTLALGTKPDGFVFDPASEEPTRLVFLMSIPAPASGMYLKLLAGLIESLRTATSRSNLLSAKTAPTLWKRLAAETDGTIS